MATSIVELFGYQAWDRTAPALNARGTLLCPFLKSECIKRLSDGTPSGVCTLKPATSSPVICCPYRLYGDNYRILEDVAVTAFGGPVELVPGIGASAAVVPPGKTKVAVFGKRWGKELRLPNRGKAGSYFVDWILARLDGNNALLEFVAVEVQSIDTTGNYQAERLAVLAKNASPPRSTAGFNWENVNKRILPQLIYKGHVLRQEKLCRHGLFFICPLPVYNKIGERLGGGLRPYQPQPGSLTFVWYDLEQEKGPEGVTIPLKKMGSFTTTIDQVALAFTAPSNLPDPGVYEKAIRAEI